MTKENSISENSQIGTLLKDGSLQAPASSPQSISIKKNDDNSSKIAGQIRKETSVRIRKSSGSSDKEQRVQYIANESKSVNVTAVKSQKKPSVSEVRSAAIARRFRNIDPSNLQDPSSNQPQGKCCGCLLCFLFCCSTGCYVLCPPVPSQITRKLAFHPPVKGHFYRLKYINSAGQEVELKSAKQAFGKEDVFLEPMFDDAEQKAYAQLSLTSSKVFIVKTTRKHYLTCMLFKSTTESDKVILFSQANATDLGILTHMDINMHELCEALQLDVYCYDYSGFGLSTGTPSEKNIYDDIQTVYEHILRTRPDTNIILMGFSMGTAASIDLASKRPKMLAGVVLVAPFCSGIRLVTSTPAKESTACCDPFKSVDKCSLIDVPTLLIHGNKDDVVPVEHSKEIFKRLRKPARPLYIYEANHMTVFSREFPQTIKRMRHFIHYELDD